MDLIAKDRFRRKGFLHDHFESTLRENVLKESWVIEATVGGVEGERFQVSMKRSGIRRDDEDAPSNFQSGS